MRLRDALIAALYAQQAQLAAMQLNTNALIDLVLSTEDGPQPAEATAPEDIGYTGPLHSDDADSHPANTRIKIPSFEFPYRWLCSTCGKQYNGIELIKEDR